VRTVGGDGTTAGNITFVTIHEAGHMTPYDKPEESLVRLHTLSPRLFVSDGIGFFPGHDHKMGEELSSHGLIDDLSQCKPDIRINPPISCSKYTGEWKAGPNAGWITV